MALKSISGLTLTNDSNPNCDNNSDWIAKNDNFTSKNF